MASIPTPPHQGGHFSTPYHTPTSSHHQPAPFANMEASNTLSVAPAKRSPQEDVQFVSVHPAKKGRGSKESSASGGPAPINIHPQDHQHNRQQQCPDAPQQPFHNERPSTHNMMGPGHLESHKPDQGMLNRGLSMPPPCMESYVFPQPPGAASSQTSRSSPMLSPKQLPPPMLPTPGFNTSLQSSREFHVPWGMSALYPQPTAPMPPPSTPSQSLASTAPSMAALHRSIFHPSAHSNQANNEQPSSRPQSPRKEQEPTLTQAPKPDAESEKTQRIAPATANAAPEPKKTPPPPANSDSDHRPAQDMTQAPPQTGLQSPALTPHTEHAEPAHSHALLPQAVTGIQAHSQIQVPKPPCLVCEQMRQQLFINQANGIPTSLHNPRMAHGWHGASPVHQMQQQLQMTSGGFGMGPNSVPQGMQSRYQPVAHGQPFPMGYLLPQMPYQVPVQVQQQQQRIINATGTEQMHSGLPQVLNNAGQPAALGLNSQYPHQVSHSQFTQSQFLPTAMTMAVPTSAAQQAPQSSSPPSPAAHQQTSPHPNLAQAGSEPRKYSPNLIVDIAETCEELFPWDEVAKRHNVHRTKVTETFSAIIQLPLLRCTTDKKKHGQLATNRLREYTKAKKNGDAPTAGVASARAVSSTPATTAPATIVVAPTSSQDQPQMRHGQPSHGIETASMVSAQDRPHGLPGIFEMTGAPLGLPSTMNGLGGPWQR